MRDTNEQKRGKLRWWHGHLGRVFTGWKPVPPATELLPSKFWSGLIASATYEELKVK